MIVPVTKHRVMTHSYGPFSLSIDNLLPVVSALNLNTQDSQFDDMRNQANESIFINRELSWLEFNERVLQQAYNSSLPLLERASFLRLQARILMSS